MKPPLPSYVMPVQVVWNFGIQSPTKPSYHPLLTTLTQISFFILKPYVFYLHLAMPIITH